MKLNRIDLNLILELHQKWLNNEEGGERANLSGVDLSKVNLSKANLSKVNLSKANLSKANLSKADLSGVDLSWTNLSEANLSGAVLYGAVLFKANLSGAILKQANLCGANLSHTSIISFSGTKHFAFYHEGMLKIGCMEESLEWWKNNYKEVGKKRNHSNHEIKLYGSFIKFLTTLPKDERNEIKHD
jgi:hypothetical protein